MALQDSQVTFKFKGEGIEDLERQAKRLGVTLKNVTRNVNGSFSASGRLATAQKNQAGATDQAAKATDRASKSQRNYIGHIAKTTILSATVNKIFLELTESLGQAVKQADLIANFPATMGALGISTEEASAGFEKLRQYTQSVGGDLTKATSSVSRFAAVNKNIKGSVAIFAGVNNALIAGGAAADAQTGALEQLIQGYSRGVFEGEEFRSLLSAMGPQIQLVAEELGQTNTTALRDALTEGEISMNEFITTLSTLATGTGPIAEQTAAQMQGIQFAANVLRNAMVNGLTAIYQAVGRENIVSFFTFLTQVIQVTAQATVFLINALISLFNFLSGIVGGPQLSRLGSDAEGVADSIGGGADNASDLADGIGDAGKEAKKLNKSLASFDQMNVLPDKESGSGSGGSGGAGGPAGFNAGELGDLGSIFDDITPNLQEASKWAKIFAGVLAGYGALKFAGPIIGQVKNIVKGFKGGSKAVKDFGKALQSPDFKSANKAGKGIGANLKEGVGTTFKGLPGLIGGILGGLAAVVLPAAKTAALAIGGALAGLTLPVAAAIAAAVAVIIAVIFTVKDNWDTIVSAMTAIWEGFTKIISDLFRPVIEELKKQFDNFLETVRPGIEKIQELFQKLKDKLAPVFKRIKDALQPIIDKVKELYKDHVEPLIDRFKEWSAESGALLSILKVIGITISVVVLAPLALLVAAVALVVVGIAAVGAALVFVIAKLFEFAAYIIGGGLWEDIQNLASATGQWISDKFNEAIDFVTNIFSTLADWFRVEVWEKIMAVFSGVVNFYKDIFQRAWEAITTVWDFAVDYFADLWDGIVKIFSVVIEFFKDIFQKSYDAIKSIWDKIPQFFKDRWQDVKNVFSGVLSFYKTTFQRAWDAVKNVFSGVQNFFKVNVIDRILSAFRGIKDKLIGFFSGVWDGVSNGLKSALNSILKLPLKVPSVSVAGKTIGGQTLIPRLARGGIVDQPTTAVIGEDGREAVVPLENNMEWLDKLAAKINSGNKGGEPMQLTVQIGEEQIASKVIELINEKTNMSGRNVIYV